MSHQKYKMYKLIAIVIISLFVAANANRNLLIEYKFTLGNEGWEIVGNKLLHDPCDHARYNIKDMSQYITGKDDLINVDYKFKDDKNLWYFKSPAIENVFLDPKKRYFISFNISVYSNLNIQIIHLFNLIELIIFSVWQVLHLGYTRGTPQLT